MSWLEAAVKLNAYGHGHVLLDTQLGLFFKVPVYPFPDESAAEEPLPSFSFHQATNPFVTLKLDTQTSTILDTLSNVPWDVIWMHVALPQACPCVTHSVYVPATELFAGAG